MEIHLVEEIGIVIVPPLVVIGVAVTETKRPSHARHTPLLVQNATVAGEVATVAAPTRITKVTRTEK